MKKSIFFIFMVFTVLIFATLPANADRLMTLKIGKGQAMITALDGTAQVMPDGKRDWRNLKVNDVLRGGDEVKTGPKSRMELVMPDNSTVRFADNSHFKILQYEAGDDSKPRNVKIHVAAGRTWANVSKAILGKGRFELSCQNAVAGVRGTVYRMNVNDDKSALVRVYDGQVEVKGGGSDMGSQQQKPVFGPPTKVAGPGKVEGPKKISMEEWVYLIKSMQEIRIGATGVPQKPRDFTEKEDKDAWTDWNREMDKDIDR